MCYTAKALSLGIDGVCVGGAWWEGRCGVMCGAMNAGIWGAYVSGGCFQVNGCVSGAVCVCVRVVVCAGSFVGLCVGMSGISGAPYVLRFACFLALAMCYNVNKSPCETVLRGRMLYFSLYNASVRVCV